MISPEADRHSHVLAGVSTQHVLDIALLHCLDV